jgi:hypothetical protein
MGGGAASPEFLRSEELDAIELDELEREPWLWEERGPPGGGRGFAVLGGGWGAAGVGEGAFGSFLDELSLFLSWEGVRRVGARMKTERTHERLFQVLHRRGRNRRTARLRLENTATVDHRDRSCDGSRFVTLWRPRHALAS